MTVDWRAVDELALADGFTYSRVAAAPREDPVTAACALARRVELAPTLREFSVEQLRGALFFGQRKRRWDGGWPESTADEEALALRLVAELTRRMGRAWVVARMATGAK